LDNAKKNEGTAEPWAPGAAGMGSIGSMGRCRAKGSWYHGKVILKLFGDVKFYDTIG